MCYDVTEAHQRTVSLILLYPNSYGSAQRVKWWVVCDSRSKLIDSLVLNIINLKFFIWIILDHWPKTQMVMSISLLSSMLSPDGWNCTPETVPWYSNMSVDLDTGMILKQGWYDTLRRSLIPAFHNKLVTKLVRLCGIEQPLPRRIVERAIKRCYDIFVRYSLIGASTISGYLDSFH